jgi:hypothetical protein
MNPLKDAFAGILGTALTPFLKSLRGAGNSLFSNASGKALARAIYKFIAQAGDPKIVPQGTTPQQRADLVRAAGAAVKARVLLLAQGVDEFTEAQAGRELTRGTPQEAAGLEAREREEMELQTTFGNLLGEKL